MTVRVLACHITIAAVAGYWILVAPAWGQQVAPLEGTRMVDLDGHPVRVLAMNLDRRQAGEPVVVFEAGATQSLEAWSQVLPHVARRAPVVAYDRAGLGQSRWDEQIPTPQHVIGRLDRLLDVIGAEPPYLLVGFSWGGVLSRYYAGAHPQDVVGLVLVDPGPIVTQTRNEMVAPFDSVGVGRAGYDAFWEAYASLFEGAPPAVRAEFDVYRGLMDRDPEERDLRPLPDVPVVLLVSGKHVPPPPGVSLPFDPVAHHAVDVRHRLALLQEWASASTRGTLVFSSEVTHAIPREDPNLIVWAVERVLAALER